MNQIKFLSITNELTHKVSNKYPLSTPCVIFRKDKENQVHFIDYTIDKDVLSQIIFDSLTTLESGEYGVPIVISLNTNLINRMESAGVYYLNVLKNEYVYLFGKEDQEIFFESLIKAQRKSNINHSLLISFLTDSQKQCHVNKKLSLQLNKLIHLHGNIYSEITPIEYAEEIPFPLLNKNFNLRLLHWIKKKGGVENVK